MRKIATLITIVFLFTILFNNFALVIASYAQDESMQEKEVIDDINPEEQEKIEDEEENIDIEETDNLEDKNELTQNNVEENDTNKQESSIETENKTMNKVKAKISTKTIEDGIYEIETALDSNKVLDVLDASKISGANVQIFTRNNAHCQKVEVKYQGNGYYTLAFIHSNMLLDVSNGNIVNHTNVWQCRPNGADAQKWVIKDAGNGYYNIISKRSNTYLTVAEGKTANCTNIEIDTYNGGVSQKFKFNNLAPTKATQTIKDGIYEIETGVDSNKALDVVNASMISGGNVRIYDKNKEDCQRVKVKYMGDGYYTLTFEHSKMLLDVSNGKIENHTNVWQCRPNGADAQKWVIKDAGDGYYYIISKQSNTYLTVSGGNVEISTKIEGLSQKFKFNDVSKIYGTQTIEDGIYEIETGVDSSKALDVLDASMISGANVQIYPKNQAKCQQVNVKYVGSGYYTLTFVHSNMLLDVSNGRVENHTNVWQCRENGADAQKWIIKDAGNGYYNIISKHSKTYLTVAGGNTANCTNIEIDARNGGASQKFKFNPTRAIYPNYSNFEQLDEARYPGYKARLRQLQSKYPNWTIKIKYTGLDWNTVIDNQYGFSSSGSPRSLTQSPWLNEWKSSEDDNKYDVSQTWYRASKKGIAYMMDPRNSLEEEWIFQFQNLGSSSGTYEDIYKMVEGTFLDTDSCIKAILQVAKEQNISPFHIASRILHEQGSDGRGVMNGYTYMGRKVYNLYNIAVTGNTQAGIVAGAKYAYERQWFTPEASIKGGAEFLSKNYIAKGQSTLYFQKYNVINSPLYEHQYMQNIRAANDEGNRVYKSYRASNLLDSRFEFTIPVFENMPVEDAPVPRR